MNQDQEEALGSEEEEDVEDDNEGWITPSNIQQIYRDMGCSETTAEIKVGCMTTDFAMQVTNLDSGSSNPSSAVT